MFFFDCFPRLTFLKVGFFYLNKTHFFSLIFIKIILFMFDEEKIKQILSKNLDKIENFEELIDFIYNELKKEDDINISIKEILNYGNK